MADESTRTGRPYEFRELLVPSREDCEALLATITDALRSAGSGFGYAMEAVEELRSILAVDE